MHQILTLKQVMEMIEIRAIHKTKNECEMETRTLKIDGTFEKLIWFVWREKWPDMKKKLSGWTQVEENNLHGECNLFAN